MRRMTLYQVLYSHPFLRLICFFSGFGKPVGKWSSIHSIPRMWMAGNKQLSGHGAGSPGPIIAMACTASLPAHSSLHLADAIGRRRWVQANYFHYFLVISVLHSSKALKTLNQQEYANLRLGHKGTAWRSREIGDSCCPLSGEDKCSYHHAWWQEEGWAGLLRSFPIWEVYEYRYQLRAILHALFIMKMTQI